MADYFQNIVSELSQQLDDLGDKHPLFSDIDELLNQSIRQMSKYHKLTRELWISNGKNLGVFYTPHELVEFVKLQLEKTIDFSKVNSILEPSAGDGRFIESILKMIPEDKLNIKLIEIDTESCRKLREKFVPKYKNIVVNNDDFLFLN